jgi:hypothetical protein
MPGYTQPGKPNFRAQGTAYVDPNISGVQPTGDLFGAYNSGSTMDQVRRNDWLNSLSEMDKMRAMNRMGYWTGGQKVRPPDYTPTQAYMNQLGLKPGETYTPEINGAYAGAITADQSGNISWTPLQGVSAGAPGSDGRFKTPGLHADRTNVGYGGGPGPGRTPPGKVSTRRKILDRRTTIPEAPGMPGFSGLPPTGVLPLPSSAGAAAESGMLGFPNTPPAPPNFLPMTPQYEAGRRQADDAMLQQLQSIQNQQNLVDPTTQLQQNRLTTDQGYAGQKLDEQLAERGLYQSGVNPYLYQRDISIPYGRAYQDLALGAGQQYGDLSQQEGGVYGNYNAALTELLLNRAAQAAQQLPLSLPQFYPPQGVAPYGTVPTPRHKPTQPKGRPKGGKPKGRPKGGKK